jgi:Trk K+ transport system NAD-binding subunit
VQRRSGREIRRNLRASWRDTLLLLRQFAWPLFFFSLAMVGGGLLYYTLSGAAGEPLVNPVEGIYTVLTLTFLQPSGEFPGEWYLEIFYFLMPVIGIGILAQGLADFGVLFFNRRARGKEWEMAVASTFNNHVVLVGLGHLGFRVMRALQELAQEMVVIEINPKANLITQARKAGIPVIHDDAQRDEALEGANVAKARAIVVCTQNDSLNLHVALRARKLNPAIKVVVRIFDDELARAIEEQFGYQALSATGMAAPMFAAAASGMDITRPVTIEGQPLSLASLAIQPASALLGRSIEEIEQGYDVSIVLLRQNSISDFHPAGERCLEVGHVLAVFGGPEQLGRLTRANR